MFKKAAFLLSLGSQIANAATWQVANKFDDQILHERPYVGINSAQMVNQSVVLTGLGAYAVFDTNGKVRFTKSGFNALVEAVPGGDRHLVAFGDDKWQVTDIYSGEVKFSDSEAVGIMSAAFSADESRVVLGLSRGGTILINLLDRSRKLLFSTTKFQSAVAFSPDQTKILASDYDDAERYRQYRVFDVSTGKELYKPLGRPHGGMPHHRFQPKFTFDGKIITANDTYLDLYDSKTGQRLQEIVGGHTGRVSSLIQKPASTLLVYGSDTGDLVAWDLNRGQIAGILRGYADQKEIHNIDFNCDGTRLLTTREQENDIVVWDTSSSDAWKWKQVATIHSDQPVGNATFGPQCSGIITSGGVLWVEK